MTRAWHGYLTILIAATLGLPGFAQLQITEIMYDTAADEGAWEWFEVFNASSAELDLDGYVFDDFSLSANARRSPNILGVASGGRSAETIVGSHQVAILYNGAKLDFEEERFRSAWSLSEEVTLIGVDGFQSLNNSGDIFGIWPSMAAYNLDLRNTDEDESLEVATFDSAVAWIDFGSEGFPRATNVTLEWTGTGGYQDGAQWIARSAEDAGVVLSRETLLPTSPLNSDADVGSPGTVGASGQAAAMVISEIMYNPASSEPSEWEWIEIVNGLDQDIDFTETPFYLDDVAGNSLSQANISSGAIPAGGVGVLIRDTVATEHFSAAWGDETNLIPVSNWPSLNNGGDTVGIWEHEADYLSDSSSGEDRSFELAISAVAYADGGPDEWPNVADGQSIRLVDFDGDLNEPSNWALSSLEDGQSYSPQVVFSSNLVDHAGGDLGTPGQFGGVGATQSSDGLDLNGDGSINGDDAVMLCDVVAESELEQLLFRSNIPLGDFDFSGRVEFSDFLVVAANFGDVDKHYGEGDADCDGEVSFDDFLIVSMNFGRGLAQPRTLTTVPEPYSLLGPFAFAALYCTFRRVANTRDVFRMGRLNAAARSSKVSVVWIGLRDARPDGYASLR